MGYTPFKQRLPSRV